MAKNQRANNRNGQSLVEIMIGLGIGALLIGSAVLGITFTLRSSSTTQTLRLASEFNQDLLDRVHTFGKSNWQNIYGLGKGENEKYFLNASASTFIAVRGEEGRVESDIGDGLVAHWKFDEATSTAITTTYDASGNGNNGTLTNGVFRASSTCKVSNCLNFDGGSGYVSAPNPSNYGNDVTVALWFRGGSQTAGDWNYWVQSSINWLEFGTFGNNATFKDNNAAGTPSVSAGTVFLDNNWHHAVGVIRSNIMEIWIDGQLLGSRSDYLTGQSHTGVGNRIGGNGVLRGWAGFIDDVRIYNRALSSDEIKRLWNSLVFRRFFFVENVCRSNDSLNNITSVSPCGGGSVEDPSTEKITVKSQWITKSEVATELALVNYITRWQNKIFRQTDWSGGSGEEGPLFEPGSRYSSSTNIDTTSTPGSIKIKGL